MLVIISLIIFKIGQMILEIFLVNNLLKEIWYIEICNILIYIIYKYN